MKRRAETPRAVIARPTTDGWTGLQVGGTPPEPWMFGERLLSKVIRYRGDLQGFIDGLFTYEDKAWERVGDPSGLMAPAGMKPADWLYLFDVDGRTLAIHDGNGEEFLEIRFNERGRANPMNINRPAAPWGGIPVLEGWEGAEWLDELGTVCKEVPPDDAVGVGLADRLPDDPAQRSAWLAGHPELYDVYSVHAVRVRGPRGEVLAHLGAALPVPATGGVQVCPDCRISDRQICLVGGSDAQGRWVEVELSLASLSERLLWPVRSGREGYAWMVGPGDQVLGSPDADLIGSRPFGQAGAALRSMLDRMGAGETGATTYAWEGRRRLAAYAPVPGTQLSVAISADADEVTGSLVDALQLQAAAAGFFGVVVGLAALALWREQRRHWATQARALAERLRLQEAAAHADRLALLGTLTAGVAHELRSPLTVLLMLGEEVEEAGIDPDLVRLTREAVASLRRLSTDMTDFARRAPPEGASCEPDAVVAGALRLVAPRLRGRQRLRVTLPPLPPVAMDGGRLGQVVMNLILNAAQALGPEGEVRLSGHLRDDGVCLRVEDDGPGIAPGMREQLFEAFATTKPAGEGTGLGLYLCRAMLESAGGWIRLDPSWTGGAAFDIWLPRSPAEVAQAS